MANQGNKGGSSTRGSTPEQHAEAVVKATRMTATANRVLAVPAVAGRAQHVGVRRRSMLKRAVKATKTTTTVSWVPVVRVVGQAVLAAVRQSNTLKLVAKAIRMTTKSDVINVARSRTAVSYAAPPRLVKVALFFLIPKN